MASRFSGLAHRQDKAAVFQGGGRRGALHQGGRRCHNRGGRLTVGEGKEGGKARADPAHIAARLLIVQKQRQRRRKRPHRPRIGGKQGDKVAGKAGDLLVVVGNNQKRASGVLAQTGQKQAFGSQRRPFDLDSTTPRRTASCTCDRVSQPSRERQPVETNSSGFGCEAASFAPGLRAGMLYPLRLSVTTCQAYV